MERRIIERTKARLESQKLDLSEYHEVAPAVRDVSFFDLSRAQQVVALIGLPVESDGLIVKSSWVNHLLIVREDGRGVRVAIPPVLDYCAGCRTALRFSGDRLLVPHRRVCLRLFCRSLLSDATILRPEDGQMAVAIGSIGTEEIL